MCAGDADDHGNMLALAKQVSMLAGTGCRTARQQSLRAGANGFMCMQDIAHGACICIDGTTTDMTGVQYTCAYACSACKHTGSLGRTWSLLLLPPLLPALALRARGFWSWSLRFSLLLRAASCTRAALVPAAGVAVAAARSCCVGLLARAPA